MNNEDPGRELVLQYVFDVTTADCDMYARLRTGGLVSFLIIAATRSAADLGFGYEFLGRHNLYWVLSRMTVEILRPLRWGEQAVVVTWPKDVDGLLYLRDFEVKDQSGEIVARSTSGWLAIDAGSKRPRKVEDKFSYMFDLMKEKHSLVQKPERLAAVPAGVTNDIRATWFDFDLNKHVTSSRYIDWMIDSLPLDILVHRYPRSLSVNYLKET
ncbi:MAG: acyl-ACP thioesterase domain-containing protein, partial [Bacteroidota bacterium]